MANSLRNRIERVEDRSGARSCGPAPAGGVIYSGPRDPVAIIHALGLGDMPQGMLDVLDDGATSAPRLVGPLSESGAYGRCREHAELRSQVSQRAHSGGGWGFQWRHGRTGFVMDWSDPTGNVVREYDPRLALALDRLPVS